MLKEGPTTIYSKKELDKVADKVINSAVLKSTSMSFASGLSGGVAMAATKPAYTVQFYSLHQN